MFRPMKPETIARRAAERKAAQVESRLSLIARSQAIADREGPATPYGSIYQGIADSVRAELGAARAEVLI